MRSCAPSGSRSVAAHAALDRGSGRADRACLAQFAATRRGIEGYVRPRIAVTETTVVLVPVYDAQVTGYPKRMRDWNKDHPARHDSHARRGPLQDGR